MTSRMIAILLTLFALTVSGTAGAIIMYSSIPLSYSVENATVVAHVRISRIEQRKFQFQDKPRSCGTDYFVDVLETFKGRPLRQRSFSFYGQPHGAWWLKVQPGDEMLVLLQIRRLHEYAGGRPLDVIYPRAGPTELACIMTLSPWTLWGDEGGGFRLMTRPDAEADANASLQFTYMRNRTSVPAQLKSLEEWYNRKCEDCSSPTMVPWDEVRSEIRDWTRKH